MNESQSPLPQPSGATCRNCGAAQSANAPYCSQCGAPLSAATPSAMSSFNKLIVSLALGFGAVVFGGFGGCVVLLGGLSLSDITLPGLLLVGVPLLLAIGCVWGIFKVKRQ